MLSGHFKNCYGLKQFNLQNINFSRCNKALIYAPNGVMKSSLSKVFDDISKGATTCDRIFQNVVSNYSVTHYTSRYVYSSANRTQPTATDRIYVVNTFNNSFEFTKETVSTLLADETTRNAYNVLMAQFSGEIRQIEEKLRVLTGLTKSQIKGKLITDLGLTGTADWTDIFEKLNELYATRRTFEYLNDCTYSELFNDKAMAVYGKQEFLNSIEEYISSLNILLENNPILNDRFTDRNAETLGKEMAKHNLFNAQHTICLKDGTTVIHSLEEWNFVVNEQLDRLYSSPELSTVFQKLKKMLTSNGEVSRLRDIIVAHREIIPALSDIPALKVQTWLDCFSKLDMSFDDYYRNISQYTAQIKVLYEQASAQSARWQTVVNKFNRRFRVPFEVRIENKANFLLKDEAPNLSFKYTRGMIAQQSATLKKDDLMVSLSTGEKRALYLLYILFDLERIRQQATAGGGQFLIVADDIADSFDYKNKYAIIEYLNDLGNTSGIDLLILTHNFDFYRTVKLRLGVARNHCYIAQRDEEGIVSITEFKYQKDFFKNVVIKDIKDGNIINDDKKKLLISSIPFYRNLCEYSGKEVEYSRLTCFLHLKTTPLDTLTVKISDLWNLINPFLNNTTFSGADEDYYTAVTRVANTCVADNTNEVLLDNKLVIAIAIRLLTEKFMKNTLISNGKACSDADSNQTRKWFNQVKRFLTPAQISVIEEVNLITPESIHLNSFMFEPLIDISNWALKDLYTRVTNL
ncbi:MAG: AAA family ATPase [Akkermansia muciniphila]|jgi:energy-coupling factor transporter ATP-binding protein EcfA2